MHEIIMFKGNEFRHLLNNDDNIIIEPNFIDSDNKFIRVLINNFNDQAIKPIYDLIIKNNRKGYNLTYDDKTYEIDFNVINSKEYGKSSFTMSRLEYHHGVTIKFKLLKEIENN